MRSLAFLLATGCTSVFGLDAPVRRGDAALDAVETADAPADSTPFVCPIAPVVFDEDGDAIDDRCDACPTTASDGLDQDSDGLPNACDPNLSQSGDRILFARMFTSAADLTGLDPDRVTFSAAANGTVTIDTSGRLRTEVAFDPTLIEVRLLGVTALSATGELELRRNVSCTLRTDVCAGPGTGVCIQAAPGEGGSAQLSEASTQVRTFTLGEATGGASCSASSATNTRVTAQSTGSVDSGVIELRTNLDARTTVQSVVFYGAAP